MVFLENMRAFLPTIVLVLAVGLSIIAIWAVGRKKKEKWYQ